MEILHTAAFETPIGEMLAVSSGVGLLYLELPHASGRGLGGFLRGASPDARTLEGFAPNRAAITQVCEFLEGKRREFSLHLDVRGTEFQRSVWAELPKIPYGETRSYGDIARAIDRPRAVRAVGAANGANPLPLVLPCHRVIASDGRLQGFGGGIELKSRLLAMERSEEPGQGRLL